MIEDSILQKSVETTDITDTATHMPRLNGNAFLKPKRPPLDIDIMLFGPGVIAVTTRYIRKLGQLSINLPPFLNNDIMDE